MIRIAVILRIEAKVERNGRGENEALLANKTSLVVGAGGGVIGGVTELPRVVLGVTDDVS